MERRGKPRLGKQVREVVSIRIEPETKKKIIRDFTSVQEFIDKCIKRFIFPAKELE